jgi:hypothetical protein
MDIDRESSPLSYKRKRSISPQISPKNSTPNKDDTDEKNSDRKRVRENESDKQRERSSERYRESDKDYDRINEYQNR